jgi:hypothetical protein
VYADLPNYRNRLELPNIPQQNIDRIQEIDVLWLVDGQIAYEFEVEHTTGITEAFAHGSNILSKTVTRVIVIPEERQQFFYQRTSEPMIREKLETQKWSFIFYDKLVTFFEQNKRKTKIDP